MNMFHLKNDSVLGNSRHIAIKISAIFFFIIIEVLLYSNILEAPFILDDTLNIVDNEHVKIHKIGLNSIIDILKSPCPARPIANFSFALNYYSGGYNVIGYHLVNMTIHIITAILLFLIFCASLSLLSTQDTTSCAKNISTEAIAFMAALLWMVNPLNTQSVTYIVQRMSSMAAMFYILSLWCYINARKIQRKEGYKNNAGAIAWFSGATVSCLLAMASKQNAVTLPLFILLYEWFFFQDLKPLKEIRAWRPMIVGFLIIIIAAAIYLGKNPLIIIQKTYSGKNFSMTEHVMSEWRVMVYYISLILFPATGRLNINYDYPVSHSLIHPPTTIIALIAIASLLGLAVYAAKKDRLISFAIIWFFGNLLLESSFLGLALIFEHRTYLPSMMVCLIIILLILRFIRNVRLAIVIIAFAVIANSLATYQRNLLWADKEKLWADCVQKSPHLALPHHNLAKAYGDMGDIDAAIDEYNAALQCDPKSWMTYKNLGQIFLNKGELSKALSYYNNVLAINPDDEGTHNNLGAIYEKLRDTKQAISEYRAALRIYPDYIEAYVNLGAALLRQGDIEAALEWSFKGLSRAPDDINLINNIGEIRLQQTRLSAAIIQFQKAISIDPVNVRAQLNLGVAFAMQGRTDDSIRQYQKVIRIDPGIAEVYNNLGILMIKKMDLNMARFYFKKALEIDPKYTNARNNFMKLEAKIKASSQISPSKNEQ